MNKTQIHIEPASLTDAVRMAELSRDEIETGLGWSWTPQRVAACFKRADCEVLRARYDSAFAGFGIMRLKPYKANLQLLAIAPRFRRHGIASRLLTSLESKATELGIEDFYVQVRERNHVAINFYQRFQYQLIDRNPRYYKQREAAVILYKYCPTGRAFKPAVM